MTQYIRNDVTLYRIALWLMMVLCQKQWVNAHIYREGGRKEGGKEKEELGVGLGVGGWWWVVVVVVQAVWFPLQSAH